MNSPAFGLRIASAIFALFAVAHVVRLVEQVQVTVGSHQIPMSLSVIALIIAATLSIWRRRIFRRAPLKSLGVKRSVPLSQSAFAIRISFRSRPLR